MSNRLSAHLLWELVKVNECAITVTNLDGSVCPMVGQSPFLLKVCEQVTSANSCQIPFGS